LEQINCYLNKKYKKTKISANKQTQTYFNPVFATCQSQESNNIPSFSLLEILANLSQKTKFPQIV